MLNSTPLKIDLPKHLFTSMSNLQSNQQASAKDDRQIYLNSLALYAADWYLQCLQFQTQHDDRADWWIQYLSRSATLEIVGIGKLECVPVTGDAVTATISPDLQFDRIGYLFVKLDESLTSAQIIGLSPKYSETVRLDRLQSTDRLIDYLCDLEVKPVTRPVIDLGKWAEGIFDEIWQNIEGLSLTPAYRNKRALLAVKTTGGGRQVKLGHLSESPTVLVTVDYKQIDAINFDLYLQVHPEIPGTQLPSGLKFSAIDDLGAEIGSVHTMTGDLAGEIVLEHGKKGEGFSIEIEFEGFKTSESFKI
jgi:Protein of unknown function (DUF1822)